MKLTSRQEKRIQQKRELCLKKREAIIEKLAGRDVRNIASYETDSFYALYSELSRLSQDLAADLPPDEGAEYIKLARLCDGRTELIKNKKYKK